MLKALLAAAANRPTYTSDFPDVKFRVAALKWYRRKQSGSGIRTNPDRAQKLISSSMFRHLSTRNISCKSMHAFFSNLRRIKFHRNPSVTSSDIPLKCKNPVGVNPVPNPAPLVRHLAKKSWHTPSTCLYLYKYIGDDTKAAARQSPNCFKNKKIWRKTIFNMADGIITLCNVARSWHWFRQVIAPCNVACGSGIMTVNSPSGSTLQCGRWL